MNVDFNSLRTNPEYSVHNENKKAGHTNVISNMTKVSNADAGCKLKTMGYNANLMTKTQLENLIERYKIKSIHVMNDKISSIYAKLPEGVNKEKKHLAMLTAQQDVLSDWKNKIQNNSSDPIIKMNCITSRINKIKTDMVFANPAQKKELLAEKEILLSEKQSLRFVNTDTTISIKKDRHNLNKINNELAGIKQDIAIQTQRLAWLKSCT